MKSSFTHFYKGLKKGLKKGYSGLKKTLRFTKTSRKRRSTRKRGGGYMAKGG